MPDLNHAYPTEPTTNPEPHVARSVIVLVGGSIWPDLYLPMDTGVFVSVVDKKACEHGHKRKDTAAKCLKARVAHNEV